VRRQLLFRDSGTYWERRYAKGGSSGSGSRGGAAAWKAEVVNGWVREHGVTSVLDLGCGDGTQLSLADYPRYVGLDRSATAIRGCIRRFEPDPSKSFLCYDPLTLADPAGWLRADLALSMEVLFHLVEDDVFDDYLRRLFDGAERFVVICSTDTVRPQTSPHERHRPFTPWVAEHRPQWQLVSSVAPPDEADLLSSLYLFAQDLSTT
jgi:SAM-dependent methyltransferase